MTGYAVTLAQFPAAGEARRIGTNRRTSEAEKTATDSQNGR
jgi:hypothetical protein